MKPQTSNKKGRKPAGMMATKREENPLFTIEPFIAQDLLTGGKEIPTLAQLKLNRPIMVDRRYIEAARAISEIHQGMSFENIIESALRHGLEHYIEQQLMSTKQLGRYFSYSVAKKYNLPTKIDL